MKYLIIFLFPLNCYAQLTESMSQKLFEAWSKQTGFEIEISATGNYVYKKIPEAYQKVLAIIAPVADTLIKKRIEVCYKYEF